MGRRRYVTEITVLVALGLAAGASRASAETAGEGAQSEPLAGPLAHAVETAAVQRVEGLTSAAAHADECQARVLLDCIGVPTVQRLDSIGQAPSAEGEADAADRADGAADPLALRQLIDRSISQSAQPAPEIVAEPVVADEEMHEEPPAVEAPAIPSTAEQLAALQQAVDAAGHSDQLQVAADSSGDALEIIWPVGAGREP